MLGDLFEALSPILTVVGVIAIIVVIARVMAHAQPKGSPKQPEAQSDSSQKENRHICPRCGFDFSKSTFVTSTDSVPCPMCGEDLSGKVRIIDLREGIVETKHDWKLAGNWDRVKEGMSQAQVTPILGPPTSIKNVGSRKELVYLGDVLGSGCISGNVEFIQDRVSRCSRQSAHRFRRKRSVIPVPLAADRENR